MRIKRSNRSHPPTSPNIAPATESEIPKYDRKRLKRHVHCRADPSMIRPWPCQSATRQLRLLLRFPHALPIEIYNINALWLCFQISPNAALATKSDTWTSPNIAPATKNWVFCLRYSFTMLFFCSTILWLYYSLRLLYFYVSYSFALLFFYSAILGHYYLLLCYSSTCLILLLYYIVWPY